MIVWFVPEILRIACTPERDQRREIRAEVEMEAEEQQQQHGIGHGPVFVLRHLLVTIFLSNFANFMVIPSITDVTMLALCPGQDECSLAIYLSGLQQAIIGLGAVVMTPLMGHLSDKYGRKALLTLPMTLSIIPLVILAYCRETNFYYAYLVSRTVTAMITEGSITCLALAFVADTVGEGQRASVFGILLGIGSASFVCGTLSARFLSTTHTFQVATFVSMVAVVYMRIYLKDTTRRNEGLIQPILSESDIHQFPGMLSKTNKVFQKFSFANDLISLLRSSSTFSQAVVVAFFNSLAEGGMQASLLYFLKARFQFNKNQFADLFLIVGVAGTISQLLVLPVLYPIIGEEKLLSLGLLVGFANMLLYSISWSFWVPYVVSIFSSVSFLATPCIRSIASKQVGPHEQGKAQGCISGVSSFANIISPLLFSPLTALFLSERAPFNFPGFSLLLIGFAVMVAFVQSVMIRKGQDSA